MMPRRMAPRAGRTSHAAWVSYRVGSEASALRFAAMPATSLIDPHAERVGALVRDAFLAVLGDRLEALLAHGSAVTGGYIEGLSDFDVVVYLRGPLTLDDSLALQARLGEADHAPFAYLQISRAYDLDAPPPIEDRRLLIDGAYAELHGHHPKAWPFHDEDTLRASSDRVFDQLPAERAGQLRRWSLATGERRHRELRFQLTLLKPSLRALLVRLSEPVIEVWTAPYPELARRWTSHDPEFGARFASLLGGLPPAYEDEAATGAELLALLEAIATRVAVAGDR